MNLITLEEGNSANPFVGRDPPRTLDELFSEVVDKEILEGYFSNGRLSDVRQRNLIGTNMSSLHVKMNSIMSRNVLKLEYDNYFIN